MTSSPAASADASAASSSAISSSVILCVHALGSALARSGPSQPPGKVGRLCFLDDDAEDDEDATARVIGARRGRAAHADARATWVAGEMKAAAADIAAVLRFCAPLGVVTKRSGEP